MVFEKAGMVFEHVRREFIERWVVRAAGAVG
jgi:hypothetical protein